MPYITTAELAERPGARELALAASSDTAPVVAYALMDATLRGADRSAWTPEQVAAADAALQRVQDAVAEAGAVIDGYLAQRGYALPLSLPPTSTGKSLLTAWARSISRYLLNGKRITRAQAVHGDEIRFDTQRFQLLMPGQPLQAKLGGASSPRRWPWLVVVVALTVVAAVSFWLLR